VAARPGIKLVLYKIKQQRKQNQAAKTKNYSCYQGQPLSVAHLSTSRWPAWRAASRT
jgi:hypothetical protein